MGYRSEVGFVIPVDGPKFEDLDDVFDEIAEYNGYRLYIASWLKWYPNYPLVEAVETYFEHLEQEDKHDEYYFTRVGEENGDIETAGEFYDNPFELGPSQTVYYTIMKEKE